MIKPNINPPKCASMLTSKPIFTRKRKPANIRAPRMDCLAAFRSYIIQAAKSANMAPEAPTER